MIFSEMHMEMYYAMRAELLANANMNRATDHRLRELGARDDFEARDASWIDGLFSAYLAEEIVE